MERILKLAGRSVRYTLHFSSKAQRLSLKISPEKGLVCVVPRHLSSADIDFDLLLKTKANWILHKLEKHANLQEHSRQHSFVDGCTLPFMGREITLRVVLTSRKRPSVSLQRDALFVCTPEENEEYVCELATAWYKYAAKKIIPQRVEQLNARLCFQYNAIAVRDQKSRWGSCSRKRMLSFNWRLLRVPLFVMDYLIYHELAHLKEMNHSVRFWHLVQTICPQYREAERWLKKNGLLMFW